MITSIKRIEKHIKQSEWKKARLVIMSELKKSPNDHWLLTRLSTTYYEEQRYARALKTSEKALKLAPKCPLVLWDYAGTLDMVGRHVAAINIWKKLLSIDANKLAYGECGEGLRWARSLLNDARYRIGISYWKMGKLQSAAKFLKAHLDHRAPGIPSIYDLPLVKRELNSIDRQRMIARGVRLN